MTDATDPAVVDELVDTLRVIANASERSETAFGGKMSDVTRVFAHITRVARAALAKYATQQALTELSGNPGELKAPVSTETKGEGE